MKRSATPVALPTMPIAVPPECTPEWKFAYVATVFGGSPEYFMNGTFVPEDESISDSTANLRLHMYCGTFREEDFAAHVGCLLDGSASALLGAERAAACSLRVRDAEALLGPIGFSCSYPACVHRATVKLPPFVESMVRQLPERIPRFQKCSVCRFSHYCSTACQHADWPRHRRSCTSLRNAYDHGRRRACEREQESTCWWASGAPVFFLWSHLPERRNN